MFEMLLDNRNGQVWDIAEIVSGITWKTSRLGRPGSLEFTLIKGAIYQSKKFDIKNGDVVRFKFKNQNVFYGYVFSIDSGKDEAVKITCYDQIRYLTASDTYVFAKKTATEIIQQIAKDFNLRLGHIEDTRHRIPTMVEDGQKLIDIIDKALVLTLHQTTRIYVFYDDFGSLVLRNVEDMVVDFIVGDGSLMYDYSSKASIDTDTYNRIKLYKDNKDTGKREIYQAQDSANIAKWGILQLYQSVDENMNKAQISDLLDRLMALKNRESKSLKIEAIGDARIRAGCYVPIQVEEFGINQPYLIDECTHRFDGTDHTMSLELKVIE